MTEASFASLGPRLLARKGGAKPAMRPQAAALPSEIANATSADGDALEDLGWNDMGGDAQYDQQTENSAEVVPISTNTNADKPAKKAADASNVVVKRDKKSAKKNAKKPAKRAAFTLRLDTDRHLKLRLASTMQGISAQALVTKALDSMLADIEDLDALAARMKRN
ncbi:MAG: hypothetical protein AAGK17_04920 [Pseudomonadota bacterium]